MKKFELFAAPQSKTAPVPEERKLVLCARNGDRDAYRTLVEKHHAYIVNLFWRQIGDQTLSEDLTQEVFLKAYQALPRFRLEASFKTWITRIALNLSATYLSSVAHRDLRSTDSLSDPLPLNSQGDLSSNFHDGQALMQSFRYALTKLPSHYQVVVVLIGFEGKSYEEAAMILEIPIGTVRSRLSKARAILKQTLEEL